MAERPPLVVLTGPTASGKTALGVELALRLDGEVVSADSMQIYRRMDIGTAKPTAEEMRGVPHHMLSVAEPEEAFSVSRYVELAKRCVEEIYARGKRPVLVGGTGLYIDALLAGWDFARSEDAALRAALDAEYDARGGAAMLETLAAFDPLRAAKLHPGDKRRIVRAIEVYRLTGETITAHDEAMRRQPPRYGAVKLALCFRERAALYARIDRRVDQMMDAGLLDEVKGLLASGVPAESTAMQAIGYKELAEALAGRCGVPEAVEAIRRGSRRYAKRQLTWLRRDAALHWIEWDAAPDLAEGVRLSTNFIESTL